MLPIDGKQIIFFSDVDYSDNSRVLYEYMYNKYHNFNYVWLMRGKERPSPRKNTEFVGLFGSLRSVRLLATAKYIFYTHPLGDLFRPREEQMVVNLWHGIPFKGKKGYTSICKPQFNILLCLGKNNISTSAKFVGCDESLVKPWGYPRIDLLLDKKGEGASNPFAPSGFNGKLIIWMPTFRMSKSKHLSEIECDNSTGLPLLGEEKSVQDFNRYLNLINVVVIVKIHHLQADKSVFDNQFSNIVFLKDEDILDKGYQLYEIVAKSDALLTDYSSIYADYLVVNRPIGFILDDLEEYEKSRGAFMYNPITEVLAGNHIYNYSQLQQFCYEIAKEIDSTKDIRNKALNDFIDYPDNNNCKRLLSNIGIGS